ncbi:MAG: cytochrome c biogenesis protein CcsA [Akkermansiaceae bacterium]|nr:cytochrome c biogenesis protein CcsA [Verrucomicrobiales bacterium]
MKRLLNLLPWAFLLLFATEIFVVMLPKKDGQFHTLEFGRLPVLMNGRIQPLDSVARNSLLQIRSTGDLPLEILPSWQFWRHPKKLKSTEWLLEVFFKPELADTRPIFLIHHPDLISELKLGEKGIEKSGLRYYTFEEIQPVLTEINAQGQKAGGVEDAQRTTYQKQMLKLANAVFLYQRLKNSVEPEGAESYARLVEEFKVAVPAGVAAFRAREAGGTPDRAALEKLAQTARPFDALASLAQPLILPPVNPEGNRNGWVNIGAGLLDTMQTGEIHPVVGYFTRMADSYGRNDAAEFNRAIAGYKEWLGPKFGKELGKARAEFYFNQIKTFLHATIIYLFAFVLAGAALLTFGTLPVVSESLRRAAFYLIALAFVVHTFGLVYRMVLEGRPPVTNLYSSAIFIGWAACLLGLVLERFYKVGLGSAVAALAGFVTLLIAHNLAIGGDTMEMMRAVLDTNFWLATHVVTVTLGYAATFVAGALAIAYIVLGIFTPLLSINLSPGQTVTGKSEVNIGKALARMTYAIVCFATLFSFIGTVLGGIWADQSWGRFWGWDPKENGALLIVIWNAIILHARWGKLVNDRGLMNLAIFGNVVTAFSWFGVNMLGIGLHSYGFMDAAFKWLMLFFASQAAIIALGSLPLRLWKSFSSLPPSDTPVSGGGKSGKPAPALI